MNKGGRKNRRPYYWINALVKGLAIVEFLAEHPRLTVTEIAKDLKMDRSTCNRFLLTLKDLGYVSTDVDNRYRPSLKTFEIGTKVAEVVEIRPLAREYLKDLAGRFNETVNLGRLDGRDVVTIDVVSSRESIRFDAPIGSRSPIYTLAMGKAILAFRPEGEQAEYLKSCEFELLTPNTITDRKIFQQELATIREQGFALDKQEWAPDIRCAAVPIFDFSAFPSHAISVSGPAMRLTDGKIDEIVPHLMEAGRSLSRELGDTS